MDIVCKVESYALKIPLSVPYLGPLDVERPNEKGYFVRRLNRTIYSIDNCTMLVRIETKNGVVGWGEALAPVAPEISKAVVDELLGPLVVGQDPQDVVRIHEDLFDTMKVRGCSEGFFSDALTAIDIALWDIKAKQLNQSVAKVLGGKRHKVIKAYVSGLPKKRMEERCEFAAEWVEKGFDSIKFASAVSYQGDLEEMRSLRRKLGDKITIMADLHWRYGAVEAVSLIRKMNEYNLALAEAPVHPLDFEGQAFVTANCGTNVGIGEELRHEYAFRDRLSQRCLSVAQPEMGRLGITSFWNCYQLTRAYNCKIMPHASVGVGIFLAASIQVSSTFQEIEYHEYQHSIFQTAKKYLDGNLYCEKGYYSVPDGVGIGVEPSKDLLKLIYGK